MKKRVQTRQPQKHAEPRGQNSLAFLDDFLDKRGAWVVFALVSLLTLIIFRKFISGQYYYLFSDSAMDSLIECYPTLMQGAAYIRAHGLPLWSFAQGMGQDIMAKSLADPFYLIPYLAGPAHLAYAIVWMEAVKIVVTALVFYRFLRLRDLAPITAIVGTLLYSFSGFLIVGGEWYVFSTEACYLALLLLGFEMIYLRNDWRVFPIAVALIAVQRPFDLYMSGLFVFVYFLFRHFLSEDRSLGTFFRVLLKMIGWGSLGLVMSSFIFFANLQLILNSPRVSGGYSMFDTLSSLHPFSFEKKDYYLTALMRLFSNDLLGNARGFIGWRNYLEAPHFYIGLLPLLFAPQIFTSGNARKRVVYALFLIAFAIPVIFPYFRHAIFLFTGNYFRIYSLFVGLAFLFLALPALDRVVRGSSPNPSVLMVTAAALIMLLFVPLHSGTLDQTAGSLIMSAQDAMQINTLLRVKVVMFLLAYSLLFISFRYVKNTRIPSLALILLISFEVITMNEETLGNRLVVSAPELSDYAQGAVDYINRTDKGFFRVNKFFPSGPIDMTPYNDSQLLGFYGTMTYDSFNQVNYTRFLNELGLIEGGIETQARYLVGIANSPLLWPFASIKYHLSLQPEDPALLLGYVPMAKIGNVVVSRNARALPLGFTYDRYIPLGAFRRLPLDLKPLALLSAVVAEEPVSEELRTSLVQYDPRDLQGRELLPAYVEKIRKLGHETLKMTSFREHALEGLIEVKSPKVLFFSIPYDKGWNVCVDGKRVEPFLCNLGFTGFLVKPGTHEIRMFFRPWYFYPGLCLSLLGMVVYGLLIFRGFKGRQASA